MICNQSGCDQAALDGEVWCPTHRDEHEDEPLTVHDWLPEVSKEEE